MAGVRRLVLLTLASSIAIFGAAGSPASASAIESRASCNPLVAPTAFPLADLTDSAGSRVTAAAAAAGVVEPNVEEAYRSEIAALPDGITARRMSARVRRVAGPITIPVAFHVIQGSAGNGVVSDSQIDEQIDALNDSYDGTNGGVDTGLRFRLVATDRTVNPAWSPMDYGSAQSEMMKSKLHEGGSRTLNVYSTVLSDGFLGWATFPSGYQSAPKSDGVIIDSGSLPGGSIAHYDLGYTLVHEAGHWAGLYHTFQGNPDGCTEPGDLVADTPPERDSASGCPVGLDTCPAAGADPIHNYMDYSYDGCMFEFTAGQAARMSAQVSDFRTTSRLEADAGRRQKLGALRIVAGCGDIGCRVTAAGKIVTDRPGRKPGSFQLRSVSGSSAYGDPAELDPGVSSRSRRLLQKRLGAGWRARAVVKLTAVADTGQTAKTKLSIRIRK